MAAWPGPNLSLGPAILSQNTSDSNSRRAFQALQSTFDTWKDIAHADVDIVACCVRSGGLGKIKAYRIKQALAEIVRKRGRLELDFLSQITMFEAEDWLQKLPGVGLKTARCVLLFSLGKPALPVDTHIFRVTKQLGLIEGKASLYEAHLKLEEMVPPADVYQFHILLIEHGRKVCHARHPDCQGCVLKRICVNYTL
jgi:endonuclease-3